MIDDLFEYGLIESKPTKKSNNTTRKIQSVRKKFGEMGFSLKKNNSSLIKIKDIDLESLDYLLWKWKGDLSREWYPLIFGLKQDLQINQKLLTSERIIKSQTIPLSEFLNKGELN